MLNLASCYCIFAIVYLLKQSYSYYMDVCGVDYLIKQSKDLSKKNVIAGINISNFVILITQQLFIFVIYKFVQLIFINLGW